MYILYICLTCPIIQSMLIPVHQIQHAVYNDETNGLNNVDDQEVAIENNAYEEINNHVSGEDVVDLQNGHADIEVENIEQEVRIMNYYPFILSL